MGEIQGTPDLAVMAPADWMRAIRKLDLQPTTKLVAAMLATFANIGSKDGQVAGEDAYPSQPTLARACGMSVSTVRRHLRTLRDDLYLIERTVRGSSVGLANRSDQYRLTLPKDAPIRFRELSTTTGQR